MTSHLSATWSCLGDFLPCPFGLLSKNTTIQMPVGPVCLIEPHRAPNDLEMFTPAFVRTNYWNVLIPP